MAEKSKDVPQSEETPEESPEKTAEETTEETPTMFRRVGQVFMNMYESGTLRYWLPTWIFKFLYRIFGGRRHQEPRGIAAAEQDLWG